MASEQVLHAIDELSDSDNFEENDSDRDCIYNPSDNETADLTNYSDSDSDAEDAARPKQSGQCQKWQRQLQLTVTAILLSQQNNNAKLG